MIGTRALEAMTEPRRTLLVALKTRGPLATADLSQHIGITYEGTRQHLGQLELDGWIGRTPDRSAPGPGRPRTLFHLTTAGEHLFPKEYDELAIALIDAAGERLGAAALRELLEEVTERKVREWAPRVAGASFDQRLEALTDIYVAGDPFCEVDNDGDGPPRIIEMNCPFLEVARRRPALCSVTVSVLRRLLGHEVVRTERFQDGGGRCVFTVGAELAGGDQSAFDWEPEATADRAQERETDGAT